MTYTPIETHVSDALARLLEQFKSAPNVNNIISVLAQRVQNIEDAIGDVDGGRLIANAVGAQLDGIGQLVGQPRNGLDDPTYKVFLLGAIAKNNSNGTLGTVENIASTLFQAAAVFAQTPNSAGHSRRLASAQISLAIGSPTTSLQYLPAIQSIIQASMPAAVALTELVLFNANGAFAMAGPQSWVLGFGSINDPTAGGGFASLLYKNPAQ